MNRLLTSLLLTLLPFCTTHAQFKEVLDSVAKNNLQLKALMYQNKAEVHDLKSENVLAAPSVEYSAFMNRYIKGLAEDELNIVEEIDFPTKYAQRNKQARLQSEVKGHGYAAARRDILLSAQLTCIDLVRLNQLADIFGQWQRHAEAAQRLLEKGVEAGEVGILDLNKVKLARMDEAKELAQIESERRGLLQQLQMLNGGKSISVDEREFPEREIDLTEDAFVAQQSSLNANIKEAEATVRASQYELKMSRQSWLPNISAGYRRIGANGDDLLNGILVGVSFPVFSTSQKVKASNNRLISSRMQLDEARMQSESELRMQYAELQRLRTILDHTDTQLMRETLNLLGSALQHGEISAIKYYSEVSDIYTKMQNHIEIHCEYAKLMAQLYKNEL